jgi:BlaI family transcriptional regulator, penicillinase repressor
MARPPLRHPTELELEILKILWQRSPLSVREVRDALAAGPGDRDPAHTSVITMLNIMVRKKYLRRTKSGNAYLYAPRVEADEVTGRMLGDLVDRVFDGSAKAVMLNLLEKADLDRQGLKELRDLIHRKEKEQSP